MADPFIGEIRAFAFNYTPQGWLLCNGQALNVQQYQTLYAIIGNTYGGNTQSFNLPDLQGRVPVGMGNGPGLSQWNLGNKGGAETVALTTNQMPGHTHTAYADQQGADSSNPLENTVAASKTKDMFYKDNPQTANLTAMGVNTVAASGGSAPHENRQPYQAFNFCINYDGLFPVRP